MMRIATFILILFTHLPQANAEPLIYGIFGVWLGSDAWDYNLIGSSKVEDTGRQALEWQYRITPPAVFQFMDSYHVRYNPRDRTIYQIIGESRKLMVGECPSMVRWAGTKLLSEYPKHPFDTDNKTSLIILPIFSNEGELVVECFGNDNVLRIIATSPLRFRRHMLENRDRKP